MSPALAGGFFTTSTTWEAQRNHNYIKKKKKRMNHSITRSEVHMVKPYLYRAQEQDDEIGQW